jgi:Tfp pilus assembly protein PilX
MQIKNNSKNNQNHTGGFILIATFFALTILSLLSLCLLEVVLLENKTSVCFDDKVKSFYQAEKYLLQAETDLQLGLSGNPNVECEKIIFRPSESGEEITYYRLKSIGIYNKAKSVLCSIVLKDNNAEKNANTKNNFIRKAFWVKI